MTKGLPRVLAEHDVIYGKSNERRDNLAAHKNGAALPSSLFVASTRVRNLLVRAKRLFVAAVVTGCAHSRG